MEDPMREHLVIPRLLDARPGTYALLRLKMPATRRVLPARRTPCQPGVLCILTVLLDTPLRNAYSGDRTRRDAVSRSGANAAPPPPVMPPARLTSPVSARVLSYYGTLLLCRCLFVVRQGEFLPKFPIYCSRNNNKIVNRQMLVQAHGSRSD